MWHFMHSAKKKMNHKYLIPNIKIMIDEREYYKDKFGNNHYWGLSK